MNEEEFKRLVVAYKDELDLPDRLEVSFSALTEQVFKYFGFPDDEKDFMIQEGITFCFEKLERFNPEKGRATNFFTTCLMCHFRQIRRTNEEFLARKKKNKE